MKIIRNMLMIGLCGTAAMSPCNKQVKSADSIKHVVINEGASFSMPKDTLYFRDDRFYMYNFDKNNPYLIDYKEESVSSSINRLVKEYSKPKSRKWSNYEMYYYQQRPKKVNKKFNLKPLFYRLFKK